MRLMFWKTRPEDDAAVEKAQRELEAVRRRWPEVHEAASTMRRHAETNGFAEQIRAAFGLGGK